MDERWTNDRASRDSASRGLLVRRGGPSAWDNRARDCPDRHIGSGENGTLANIRSQGATVTEHRGTSNPHPENCDMLEIDKAAAIVPSPIIDHNGTAFPWERSEAFWNHYVRSNAHAVSCFVYGKGTNGGFVNLYKGVFNRLTYAKTSLSRCGGQGQNTSEAWTDESPGIVDPRRGIIESRPPRTVELGSKGKWHICIKRGQSYQAP
jgi:hypothetical protein